MLLMRINNLLREFMPRAPTFWNTRNVISSLLLPVSWLYYSLYKLRWKLTTPTKVKVPVICIGNVTAGGAGKTPIVIALAQALVAQGKQVHILSRGYKGTLSTARPVRVNTLQHNALQVGDEPLMLSNLCPVWIGTNRLASARAAIEVGAEILLMDDGMQNPVLHKDHTILIIDGGTDDGTDGGTGVGNNRLIPAGPLRETLAEGLRRSEMVVICHPHSMAGPNATRQKILQQIPLNNLFHAALIPTTDAHTLKDQAVIAFTGIGQPKKFFTTLKHIGVQLVSSHAYPDHHPFSEAELSMLAVEAEKMNARLVTTRKDAMRLSSEWLDKIMVVDVSVQLSDNEENTLSHAEFLSRVLNTAIVV